MELTPTKDLFSPGFDSSLETAIRFFESLQSASRNNISFKMF